MRFCPRRSDPLALAGSTEYQFKSAEEEYKDSFYNIWKQFDRDIVKVSFSTFWEFCPDKDPKNINSTLSSNLGFLILGNS